MEFFETFWTWLDGQLRLYISDNTQAVGLALAPVIGSLATIYIMIWGFLHLTGKIDEPFTAGLKRISTLVIVMVLCWQFLLYNSLIVDTFYIAPAQLAARIVSAGDPVQVIDAVWARGASVAENLSSRSSWHGGYDFFVMAYIIRFFIGALCVYTMFLIALSKVALSVLLALGPLFIVMLLFEQTRHYFTAWIAQLSNYALITILTIMVCALILGLVRKYADDTLGLGVGVRVADAFNMILVCALAILFMMQVTHIAGSLAGGGAGLNTFGAGRWGWGRAQKAAGFGLGLGILTTIGALKTPGFVTGMLSSRDNTKEDMQDWSSARRAGHRFKMRYINRKAVHQER